MFFDDFKKKAGDNKNDELAVKCLEYLLFDDSTAKLDISERLRLFHAMFITQDVGLMRSLHRALKWILEERVLADVPNHNMTSEEKGVLIAYVLCLLPHTGIKPGECYSVPTWNEETYHWDFISYRVEPAIEFKPTWGFEALIMNDKARDFAYGLKPIVNNAAPHILLLKGWRVPTGQGFSTEYFSSWFSAPGGWLLHTGGAALQNWLKNKSAVRVFGADQGGQLACGLALDPAVKEIIVYEPSNLGMLAINNTFVNKWNELSEKSENPKVVVLSRKVNPVNDYVDAQFPQWKRKRISTEKLGQMKLENHHSDVIKKQTRVCETNISNDQAICLSQRWNYFLHAQRIFQDTIFCLLLLPCRFVVIPAISALLQHKTEAVIMGVLVLTSMMFPGMLSAPLGLTAVIAASLYLAYKVCEALFKCYVKVSSEQDATCHLPDEQEAAPRCG